MHKEHASRISIQGLASKGRVSMELYNLKHPSQKVSFKEAVQLGLGQDRGLFFPTQIPVLDDIEGLLALPFVERSKK